MIRPSYRGSNVLSFVPLNSTVYQHQGFSIKNLTENSEELEERGAHPRPRPSTIAWRNPRWPTASARSTVPSVATLGAVSWTLLLKRRSSPPASPPPSRRRKLASSHQRELCQAIPVRTMTTRGRSNLAPTGHTYEAAACFRSARVRKRPSRLAGFWRKLELEFGGSGGVC